MTNLEKAEELKAADAFALRSCWECNPAHNYLKKAPGLFVCYDCSRWYMNGGYFNDEAHCKKPYQDTPTP